MICGSPRSLQQGATARSATCGPVFGSCEDRSVGHDQGLYYKAAPPIPGVSAFVTALVLSTVPDDLLPTKIEDKLRSVDIGKMLVKGDDHPQACTTSKTRRYEDLIRPEAGQVTMGRDQLEGALWAEITVFVAMPLSISKTKAQRAAALAGELRPTKKSDIDNYIKVVDALNSIVWHDDGQVVTITASRFYSDRLLLELKAHEFAS